LSGATLELIELHIFSALQLMSSENA